MPELEEFRYPFESALEYFRGSWKDIGAFHLGFAWVALLVVASLLLLKRQTLGLKLLALYFGLTLFNNPAFQLIPGATLGDVFGVIASAYYILRLFLKRSLITRHSVVGSYLLCAALAMAVHALLTGAVYPTLNADGVGLIRSLVFLKVLNLGLCCYLFRESVENGQDCEWIVREVVKFATIGILCYFLQAGILLTGHLPYGTFLDAGYVGFPSFGSVSIERGHFGKFMTPLFPVFLIMLLKQRKRLLFFSFVLVSLVNFSASSLSYFSFYAAGTLYQFRRHLLRRRYAAYAAVSFAPAILFIMLSWNLWSGLVLKIGDQAIDGHGGRSIDLLFAYLQRYPMGLSYGGSSLRTPPDLPEMNSGLYSFIAQESLLAVPLIGAFLYLVFSSASACLHIPDVYVRRALKTGILIMPFIFFSDVLWFVPTIWLPMLFAEQLNRRQPFSQSKPVFSKTLSVSTDALTKTPALI